MGRLEERVTDRIREAADGRPGAPPRPAIRRRRRSCRRPTAFLMSSAWEGLPMVLLEAGASALPVVATDVGGSRAAVLDGMSGYLVPARQPQELARAMRTVME